MSKPERLFGYEVLALLGEGAMGRVYLARADGRRVALKVLHPHLVERRGALRRFQRESLAGTRIVHPNVVQTLDFDLRIVGDEAYCISVMEYVDGRDLREVMAGGGPLSEVLACRVAEQVARGLEALHEAGMVHRDLKPENVLVSGDHVVKVADLGVALVDVDSVPGRDRNGFAGSVGYAAPEQLRGGEVGPAADLYALGVILYECLAGVHPFRASTSWATVDAQVDGRYEPLLSRRAGLSPFVAAIVDALLQPEPGERIASARKVEDALRRRERSSWWHERQRGFSRRSPRTRRATPMVARGEVLARLRSRWQSACDGDGGVVLVRGEAGIGKSRLVDEWTQAIDGRAVHVLCGSYAPGARARSALTAAFREHLVAARLDSLLPEEADGVHRAALEAHARAAAPDAVCSEEALCGAYARLLGRLAAERPVLCVIEDLHFASDDDAALLRAIVHASAAARVLLVLTTREASRWGDLVDARSDASVVLERLTEDETLQLVHHVCRDESAAREIGPRIARVADGVPLLALELARGAMRGGARHQLSDGSAVPAALVRSLRLPPALVSTVRARLDELDPRDRELLSIAALIGFDVDVELLAAVQGSPALAVLVSLDAIERRIGLVRSTDRGFTFDHHVVQEVLRMQISGEARRGAHARIANAMAARLPGGEDAAQGETAVVLFDHALRGGQFARAHGLLRRALGHLSRTAQEIACTEAAYLATTTEGFLAGAERFDILMRTSLRLQWIARNDEAEALLEEAYGLADDLDDAARSRVRGEHAWFLLNTARLDQAEPLLLEAQDLARRSGDAHAFCIATGNLGCLRYSRGDVSGARAIHEELIAFCEARGDEYGASVAVGNLALVEQGTGRFERALELLDVEWRATEDSSLPRCDSARWHGNRGQLLVALGRFDEAERDLSRAIDISLRFGARRPEARALQPLAECRLARGRTSEALQLLGRQVALAREVRVPVAEIGGLALLGWTHALAGAPVRGRTLLEAALGRAEEIAHRHAVIGALCYLGSLHELLLRSAEAISAFERAADEASMVEMRHAESEARSFLAFALRKSDPDRAAEQSRRALGLASQSDGPWRVALALSVGAAAGTAAPEQARDALVEAREGLTPDIWALAWRAVFSRTGEECDHAQVRRAVDALVAGAGEVDRQQFLAALPALAAAVETA